MSITLLLLDQLLDNPTRSINTYSSAIEQSIIALPTRLAGRLADES